MDSDPLRVAGLLLAAGGSTRMGPGAPKQLQRVGGQSLVRRAAGALLASRCDPVLVALGSAAAAVAAELDGLDVTRVAVPDWADGIGRSIAAGVSAVERDPACDAVLVLLADQVRVASAHLDRLIDAATGDDPIVASAYAGTLGVPALFGRAHFAALRALRGDTGARDYLRARGDAVTRVPFPEAEADVDTPEDLASARARTGRA